jgi:hypothetical protein
MATEANIRNVDGTGWVPIDFTAMSSIQSPLATLPIDPQNSEANYYAYAQGAEIGEYSLFAAMESEKHEQLAAKDGGGSSAYFETTPIPFTPLVDWTAVNYGSETVFSTTTWSSSVPRFVKINNEDFAVFTNDTQVRAVIGTLSGDSNLSFGSSTSVNPAFAQAVSAAMLDSTHLVVVYNDSGNSNYGTAAIGTVSGNSISFGSEYVFNSGSIAQYPSVVRIDANTFVVAYRDDGNSGYGTAVVGTVSGNTITYGSEYVFHPADITTSLQSISATSLGASKFVVTYTDESNGKYGTAAIGTVSGNSISFGSEYVFNTAWTSGLFATTIDADRFVVGYRDLGASGRGNSIIGTVSGNSISFGSEYTFNPGSTSAVSISKLDEVSIVVSYRDGGNGDNGTAAIGTVSGNTITYGSEFVFNPAATYNTSVIAMDESHFVNGYMDGGNGNDATGIVGFSQ